MAGDFIPRTDPDYNNFVTTFVSWVGAHGAAHGIAPADVTALDNAFTNDWSVDYPTHLDRQTQAQAAAVTKDESRASLTGLIRPIAAQLQADPTMTDALRIEALLPVRDTTRTRAAIPTTRPLAVVDSSQRLQHTISWRDESTPTNKAKPAGVQGAEIWYAVGAAPPADPAQYHFAALDGSTPYLLHHDPADAGKLAHYLLRWVNTRNEPGPWSETVSATIGA